MALKKTELINFLITDKDIGISKFQPPSPCLEKSQTLIEVAPYQEHYITIYYKCFPQKKLHYLDFVSLKQGYIEKRKFK